MIGFPLRPRYFLGNTLLPLLARRYGAYTWTKLFTSLALFVLTACALFRFFTWLDLLRWVRMLSANLSDKAMVPGFVIPVSHLGQWERLACLVQLLSLGFLLAITAVQCISGLRRFRGRSFRPVSQDAIMLPLPPEQIFFAVVDWPVLRALGWFVFAALLCCLPSRESPEYPILTLPYIISWFIYDSMWAHYTGLFRYHPRPFFLALAAILCFLLFSIHRLLYIRKFPRGLLGRNPAFWIWVIATGGWGGRTIFRYIVHHELPIGPRGAIIAVLALIAAFLLVPFFYMPAEWATGEPERPLGERRPTNRVSQNPH